jgi:hypothetical protein
MGTKAHFSLLGILHGRVGLGVFRRRKGAVLACSHLSVSWVKRLWVILVCSPSRSGEDPALRG